MLYAHYLHRHRSNAIPALRFVLLLLFFLSSSVYHLTTMLTAFAAYTSACVCVCVCVGECACKILARKSMSPNMDNNNLPDRVFCMNRIYDFGYFSVGYSPEDKIGLLHI